MFDATPQQHRLTELSAAIGRHPDWWQFPTEKRTGVRGFLGTGPIFFVGDQPSTNPWPERDKGRRRFYDGLARLGLQESHLTDLYKGRGPASGLSTGLPSDFGEHVALFRNEIELLRPSRVVAVGSLAHRLVSRHVPEVRPILTNVVHFAYRFGDPSSYHDALAAAALGDPAPIRPADGGGGRGRARPAPKLAGPVGYVPGPPSAPGSAPAGARVRMWTLRRDNHAHHHGVVGLAESPLHLDLWWRPDAVSPPTHVGVFALDLPALLAAGLIRLEPGRGSGIARLRIVMGDDSRFYVQARGDAPAMLLR